LDGRVFLKIYRERWEGYFGRKKIKKVPQTYPCVLVVAN
jgi:hypothetical protein